MTDSQRAEARSLGLTDEQYTLAIELHVPGGPAAVAAGLAQLRGHVTIPVPMSSQGTAMLTAAERESCKKFGIDEAKYFERKAALGLVPAPAMHASAPRPAAAAALADVQLTAAERQIAAGQGVPEDMARAALRLWIASGRDRASLFAPYSAEM